MERLGPIFFRSPVPKARVFRNFGSGDEGRGIKAFCHLPSVIGYLLAIGYRLLVIIVCLQSLNRSPGGVSFRKS